MRRRDIRTLLEYYGWEQRSDGLWHHPRRRYWWLFKLGWFRLKIYRQPIHSDQKPACIGSRFYSALQLTYGTTFRPGIILGPFKVLPGYRQYYHVWSWLRPQPELWRLKGIKHEGP